MSLAIPPHTHLAAGTLILVFAATAWMKSPPSNPESGASCANQTSHFSAHDSVECLLRIALTALATHVPPIADVSFEDRKKCDALPGMPLVRAFAVARA
jgi:hypothetical protein